MIKLLHFSAGFLAMILGLSAQTFDGIYVAKGINYVQTGVSTVIANPKPVSEDYRGAYTFEAVVYGEDLGGIPAPILSGPISLGEPFFNGGILLFDIENENVEDGEWRFGAPEANGYGTNDQSIFDGFFGNGEYTFLVNDVALTLDLSPESFPSAPVFTLSGGAWVDGKYHLPFDSALSISTSTFTEYGDHEEDTLWVDLDDDGTSVDIAYGSIASQSPNADSYSTTIPAHSFTAGRVYKMEAGFGAITDLQFNGSFPGAQLFAGFEVSTEVEIVVTPIPDPEPVDAQIEVDVGASVFIRFDMEWGGGYLIERSSDMEAWSQAHPQIIGNSFQQGVSLEWVSTEQFYRVTKVF